MLLVSGKTYRHQRDGAGDGPRHRRAKAKGLAQQLPGDAHHKAADHCRNDARLRGFFPEQGGKGRDTCRRRVEAPGEHQRGIGVLDVQGDHQRADGQNRGKDAGKPQLCFFAHARRDRFSDIADAGLHGNQQIAVRRGHDNGKHTGQGDASQANGQHLDSQRGDHSIRGAELGENIIANDLVGDAAHEEHQEDRDAIDGCSQEHALLGGFPVLCRKGPLPHLRACHGKDQIGHDIA